MKIPEYWISARDQFAAAGAMTSPMGPVGPIVYGSLAAASNGVAQYLEPDINALAFDTIIDYGLQHTPPPVRIFGPPLIDSVVNSGCK